MFPLGYASVLIIFAALVFSGTLREVFMFTNRSHRLTWAKWPDSPNAS
jgi:hypothetical protein